MPIEDDLEGFGVISFQQAVANGKDHDLVRPEVGVDEGSGHVFLPDRFGKRIQVFDAVNGTIGMSVDDPGEGA